MMAKKNDKDNESNKKNSTPLKKYKKEKKTLKPPLAGLEGMVLTRWADDRMPEMIWAVLIREKHPGEMGYGIFRTILRWLADNQGSNEVDGVTHTDIAGFNLKLRKDFINYVIEVAGTDALKPLLLLKGLPAYEDWAKALTDAKAKGDPEEDWGELADSISKVMFHQTQEATDVRWVKLMGAFLNGKMHLPSEKVEEFNYYPNKYDQRSVRPFIRSSEMMIDTVKGKTSFWPKEFWLLAKNETRCMPEKNYTEEDIKKLYEEAQKDKKHYAEPTEKARATLIGHFFDTATTTAIDARHEAVMGLALYATDAFVENSILEMGTTASGRATARIMFEAFITLKYLLHKEKDGELLWETYRDYGIGQASLIAKKYEEDKLESSMVDPEMLERIANEDKWSEYVPINLGNWDASDLRSICTTVGEKKLYDKYYPYSSGYLHANWGAVREASFQLCVNPLHRFHRIPLYSLPVLPSVNADCVELLNMVYILVNEAYPTFDTQIEKRDLEK